MYRYLAAIAALISCMLATYTVATGVRSDRTVDYVITALTAPADTLFARGDD